VSIESQSGSAAQEIFLSARWYDLGINWDARLAREIPVLCEVFGPPGEFGLLDAGCGPGRHLVGLAARGYRMTGLDLSPEMLDVAREHAASAGVDVALVAASFTDVAKAGGPFDGVYCLGNSLAAGGSAAAAEQAFSAMAEGLRPGGRFFVQILNFEKLRNENPRVRGPRVRREGSFEYVSNRVFHFDGNQVEITNITSWNDGGWKNFAQRGSLYAISREEIEQWCAAAGLVVDEMIGGYDRAAFDVDVSNDLIVVATMKA
jgi:SAM-dependent methyltransferase